MTMVNTVTEKDFDTLVGHSVNPVLVDFYADWCAPCTLMQPIIEELAREHANEIQTLMVDVDASPRLAERYGVTSIPTYLIFKEGRVVRQRVGASTAGVLNMLIKEALKA